MLRRMLRQMLRECEIREAGVAKLENAQDLKSCTRKGLWVQVPPPAPALLDLKSLAPTGASRFESGLRHQLPIPDSRHRTRAFWPSFLHRAWDLSVLEIAGTLTDTTSCFYSGSGLRTRRSQVQFLPGAPTPSRAYTGIPLACPTDCAIFVLPATVHRSKAPENGAHSASPS